MIMSDEGPDFDRLIPVYQEHIFTQVIQEADEELRARGLYAAPPPVDNMGNIVRPVMPPALSNLDRVDVLDLLGQYGAYTEYARPLATDYAVMHLAWEKTKNQLVASIRPQLRGNASQIKDAIENDPRYQDVNAKELRAKALAARAMAIYEGAEISRLTVSRAITSQGQELDSVRRENNVATNRKGTYGPPNRAASTPSRLFRP